MHFKFIFGFSLLNFPFCSFTGIFKWLSNEPCSGENQKGECEETVKIDAT